jgi:hypothetical protein
LSDGRYYNRGKKDPVDARRLVEEELPLAAVLKHLAHPGIAAECEHADGINRLMQA